MDTNGSRARVFVFGECLLDTERGQLRRGGVEVRLRPKSFEVLEYLVRHAGRLVGKRELLDAVWGRRAVTEDSVTQCIVEIRRALGRAPAGPPLRTIPRRGYLLDVTPRNISTRSPGATDAATPPVVAALSRGAPLLRIAAVLLLISVVSAGSSMRAIPTSGDIGADAQSATLALDEDRGREAFLLGRHLFHRRMPGDLQAAERQLQRALALDPANAAAWTALAGVYAAHGLEARGDPAWRLDDQRDALHRALRLEPRNVEALVRLSRVLRLAGDVAAADDAIAAAKASEPDHPLVLYARASEALRHGRLDEAIDLRRRAVRINPVSAIYRINLGNSLLGAGLHVEALAQLRQAQLLSPQLDLRGSIARALVAGGQLDAAREAFQSLPEGATRDQLLALFAQDATEADAAELRLVQRADSRSWLLLAEIAAYRGVREVALRHLETALALAANEAPGATQIVVDDAVLSPFLSPLRSDERWPWREEHRKRAT